jgi:hypothetical protein
VIGFLGEYDALAELSQVADLPEQQALETGGNGHGCGHNMLGSAAMLAAIALKNWLEETGTPGRVRYYGVSGGRGGISEIIHGETWGVSGLRYRDHMAPRIHRHGCNRIIPCGGAGGF